MTLDDFENRMVDKVLKSKCQTNTRWTMSRSVAVQGTILLLAFNLFYREEIGVGRQAFEDSSFQKTDMLWFLCYLIELGCLSGQWKIYETFQVTTKIQLHDGENPRALLAIYSNQSGAHNFLWSDLERRFEYFKTGLIAKLVHSSVQSSPVSRRQICETESNK